MKPGEEQNLWSRAAEGQWGGGKGWRRTVCRDGGRAREFPGAGSPEHRAKTVLRRKGQLRVPNAMELSKRMRDEN